MNNKKRKNWDFNEIRVGRFFWCNLYHRLKNYFKEQLCTFLERNEYSPFNINQRYLLTYVFLSIIQRECDMFCCGHTDSFKYDLCRIY